MDANRDTNKAQRLERIFLAGIDAQVALGGLAAALEGRGLGDAELRAAYIEALEGHLARIVETAEGEPRAVQGEDAANSAPASYNTECSRRVAVGGCFSWNRSTYRHQALIPYAGETVWVREPSPTAGALHIFDDDNRHLCTAYPAAELPFDKSLIACVAAGFIDPRRGTRRPAE